MDTTSLRPATPDDLQQILSIEGASHSAPWTSENCLGEMAKPYSHFWVLTDDETDEKIFGYIVFWVLGREARILNLAVHPSFRRKGLGKRLVRQAVSHCLKAGIATLSLEVRVGNEVGLKLYQALQFSITHRRNRFYSDGEDAYVMELDLGENVIPF